MKIIIAGTKRDEFQMPTVTGEISDESSLDEVMSLFNGLLCAAGFNHENVYVKEEK